MYFFETPEIKDAPSYLRLIAIANDDAAFERGEYTDPRDWRSYLDVVRQTS